MKQYVAHALIAHRGLPSPTHPSGSRKPFGSPGERQKLPRGLPGARRLYQCGDPVDLDHLIQSPHTPQRPRARSPQADTPAGLGAVAGDHPEGAHAQGLWAMLFPGKGGEVPRGLPPVPCLSLRTRRQLCWDQLRRTWTINRQCLNPAVNEALECNYQGDAEP